MAFDRSFAIGLAWRVAVLGAAMLALLYSIGRDDLAATRVLAAMLFAGSVGLLWAYVRRTNIEVARFIQAVMHGDLSQGFTSHRNGAAFDILGRQLDAAIRALRDERVAATDAGRFHGALIDEAPIALLVVDGDRVELANKAARKLFGATPGVRTADFAAFGTDLIEALAGADRRIAEIEVNGRPQRAVLTTTQMHRLGRPLQLLAVQPVHGELNAVEMAAQADLVRVLTHEIMNSMTPVTSLAQTAAELMASIDRGDDPAIADAHLAVTTLARRAEGITRFVEGYRSFIRTPAIRSRRFALLPWAEEIGRLFGATEAGGAALLEISVVPGDLAIDADPDLLAQAVLNLLKNGAEAAVDDKRGPSIALTCRIAADQRIAISVTDNGPGISGSQAGDIFLPFFTTKANGTGVGLSLVRRIVTAHGGFIAIVPTDKGACIELTL
jgi:nitrogen fixation/metabolism regulation signal transduction histidine kinase